MSNIINSEAYVKQGDKVYKVNGGSPIHTFNSVEEMNAANLADGSIACVPSSGGGGGLPVVEITSVLRKDPDNNRNLFGELSEGESNALTTATQAKSPIIVKFPITMDEETIIDVSLVFDCYGLGEARLYQAAFYALTDAYNKILVLLAYEDGAWIYSGVIL